MKTGTIIALVAATSAPMLAATGVDWLGLEDVERVLNGENVTDVAADIAQREFAVSGRIEILSIERRGEARDEYGGRVTPYRSDGVFHVVTLRFTNDGKLEYPVHTRHFKAVDDVNHTYAAEWGLTEGIDVKTLKPGGSQIGVVVFDMPSYVPLTGIVWEGEFAAAAAGVGDEPFAPPPHDHHDTAPEPGAGGPREDAEEEYRSHWDH